VRVYVALSAVIAGLVDSSLSDVMRGLDPRIHDEGPLPNPYGNRHGTASWIAGSSPAMTPRGGARMTVERQRHTFGKTKKLERQLYNE
jgi:hypothetical protein